MVELIDLGLALCKETRVRILLALKETPMFWNIKGLAEWLEIKENVASHHVEILERTGAVFCKKEGREKHVHLDERMKKLLDWVEKNDKTK